jgi:hypothetical protein
MKSIDVDFEMTWDSVRPKLEGDPAFEAITLESERIRIFKVRCCIDLNTCSDLALLAGIPT